MHESQNFCSTVDIFHLSVGKMIPSFLFLPYLFMMQNVYFTCDHRCFLSKLFEPRHEKTCLREFPTRPDTNRPARPQKLARVSKFRLYNLGILYYLSSENKGADQTARMRRLICAFVVRVFNKTHFLMARLISYFDIIFAFLATEIQHRL